MSKKVLLLILLWGAILSSCRERNLKTQVNNLLEQTIYLPDSLDMVFTKKSYAVSDSLSIQIKGRNQAISSFLSPELKMVVWYDSLGCSSCKVKDISQWDEMTDYAEALGDRFNLIFLFSPSHKDIHSLTIALRSSGFEYPVFIDKNGDFTKLNPSIPPNDILHTFLLDQNNKVILVGNPINNKNLWELYKEQIRTLI